MIFYSNFENQDEILNLEETLTLKPFCGMREKTWLDLLKERRSRAWVASNTQLSNSNIIQEIFARNVESGFYKYDSNWCA